MIKFTTIAASAFFLLLAGCSRSNEGKPLVPSFSHEQIDETGDGQTPYYSGLIEEYKRQLAEDPHNLAGNIALANAFYDSGQWREAIMFYERSLQLDPRNPDTRADMATCFRNLGMPGVALDQYRKALEFDPGHLNARYNIGIIYAHDRHDYAAAMHIWEDLLRISPHHPRADYMRDSIALFKKMRRKESP